MVTTRPLRVVLFTVGLLLLIGAGTASADDVSIGELAERADRASAANLGDLAEVTSVESVPIDINDLVVSGNLDEREARLESLRRVLADFEDPGLDSTDLRNDALEIISNPPYSAEAAGGNGLFAGVVEFLGRIVGNDAAQGVAIVIVIIVALVIAIPILNRLARGRQQSSQPEAEAETRADYQADADEAASRGDHEAAVRFLFLDGADHLERSKVIANAATISTSTVRRLSDETDFLDRFDEIAYGGSNAQSGDVSQARNAWQRLKNRTLKR